MKKLILISILLAIASLCLAISGCTQPSSAQTTPGTPPASPRQVDRVTAAPLQKKNLKLFTSQPGRIEAYEEAPLFPKVSGYVEEVLVDIGDSVTKDQPLVKLSVPELHDELQQMEALVAQAEAELRQADAAIIGSQASVETAQAKVHQAEAGIVRADSEWQRWKAEFSRIEQLAEGGSVTKKLADETLSQLRAAEAAQKEAVASVASTRASVTEAQANVQKSQADQGAAQARLRVAQANLARTKTMLGYTTIRSPFNGIVTYRQVDTGHFVQPASGAGVKPLVVVSRADLVRIFADIPELEAPLVNSGENGDAAVVHVQAQGDRPFEAKVARTSWALDSANRSLRIEFDLPNPDGLLRPGMYATVTVLLEERTDALALPITAIIREGKATFCCLVESGKITRQPIELGLRFGDEVEVVSGLEPRSVVVMARAESLSPGQAVEVLAPEVK